MMMDQPQCYRLTQSQVYLPSIGMKGAVIGKRVRLASAPAIPDAMDISRALRPLRLCPAFRAPLGRGRGGDGSPLR